MAFLARNRARNRARTFFMTNHKWKIVFLPFSYHLKWNSLRFHVFSGKLIAKFRLKPRFRAISGQKSWFSGSGPLKKEVYRAKMHSYEEISPIKPKSKHYSEKLSVESVFSVLFIFGPPKGSARNRADPPMRIKNPFVLKIWDKFSFTCKKK